MNVEILADTCWPSVGSCDWGSPTRLTTFRLEFWRAILPQILTHRMFSRSTSSSRALKPAQVAGEPYAPQFSREKPGMQGALDFSAGELATIQQVWETAFESAQVAADQLDFLGVHRQHRNRLLEPFATVSMVVTATEWENFFELRISAHSQPEIRALAEAMRQALEDSTPRFSPFHIPYDDETKDLHTRFRISAAHCARVSYKNDRRSDPTPERLVALAARLLKDKHMSPFEHQAVAYPWLREKVLRVGFRSRVDWAYNLRNWASTRYLIEQNWADQVLHFDEANDVTELCGTV